MHACHAVACDFSCARTAQLLAADELHGDPFCGSGARHLPEPTPARGETRLLIKSIGKRATDEVNKERPLTTEVRGTGVLWSDSGTVELMNSIPVKFSVSDADSDFFGFLIIHNLCFSVSCGSNRCQHQGALGVACQLIMRELARGG